MAKISTEFRSLLLPQRDVDSYNSAPPTRLSDFTPPEKKVAKKETPQINQDRFIGPEDSEEQVRLEYKSLIG